MLLKPIGGRGQEALLAAPVLVDGLPIAAAYLAAGGTPIHSRASALELSCPDEPVLSPRSRSTQGFFADSSLRDFNPDAVATLAPAGLIARVPFEFPVDWLLAVAVGGDGVVFRAGGCADCFSRTVKSLSLEAPTIALEALGALAWQRIVLGVADTLGTLGLEGPPRSIWRCEAHG